MPAASPRDISLTPFSPALVSDIASGDPGVMVDRIRWLHQPIEVVINGERCKMLTIGHLANAVGRTTWTVRYWTKCGLVPPTPFYWDPSENRARFRLYPQPFVESLETIAAKGYLGRRLDRQDWARFRDDVLRAYNDTVTPLLGSPA